MKNSSSPKIKTKSNKALKATPQINLVLNFPKRYILAISLTDQSKRAKIVAEEKVVKGNNITAINP